jgi:hypothetical protein
MLITHALFPFPPPSNRNVKQTRNEDGKERKRTRRHRTKHRNKYQENVQKIKDKVQTDT